MTALIVLLAVLVVVLVAALVYRSRTPEALRRPYGGRRILVPFTGSLDPTVLNAAIRIAHAEGAVLVPAYLLIVPLEYPEDSPVSKDVAVAMPALEAVRACCAARRGPGRCAHRERPHRDSCAEAVVGDRDVRPARRSCPRRWSRRIRPEGAGLVADALADRDARAPAEPSCGGAAPGASSGATDATAPARGDRPIVRPLVVPTSG